MTIDDIIKRQAQGRKSLRDDWGLAEGFIAGQFAAITPEQVEAGADPIPAAPVLVEHEPPELTKPDSWTLVRCYCPECRVGLNTVNLSGWRSKLLNDLHSHVVRDVRPEENETIADALPQWELPPKEFECRHGRMKIYCRLSDSARARLEADIRQLFLYRVRIRRELGRFETKHESIPSYERDSDALKNFADRQAELNRLIQEGDGRLRSRAESITREQTLVEVDAKGVLVLVPELSFATNFQKESAAWQRTKAELQVRLWPRGEF